MFKPGREPERPTTWVFKSESIAGRPVTAVIRCNGYIYNGVLECQDGRAKKLVTGARRS